MDMLHLIGCLIVGVLTSALGYSVVDKNGFNFNNFVITICFSILYSSIYL